MTEHGSGGPGEAPRTPLEAWVEVSNALIAGIHHTLNNRAGTLGAVMQVLEADIPSDHPLRAALSEEIGRLESAVGMLGLLPSPVRPHPEPIQLSDLLPPLVLLYEQHHDVRDTPCRVEGLESVLPLRTDRARLGHLLLVLMVAAGREAAEHAGEARVRARGDEREVVLEIGPAAGPAPAQALAAWAEEMGGTLALAEGLYRLSLPTLPEVRRRERAAG